MAASWRLFSGLPPCAFSRAPPPTPTQLVAALAPRHVHAIHAVHPAPPRSQPSDPPRPELVDVVAPRASDGQDAPRGGGDVRRRWGAGDVRLWWKSASSGGGRWGPQRRGGWGLPAWGEEEEEGAHVARKRGAVVTWWEVGPTKEGSYL